MTWATHLQNSVATAQDSTFRCRCLLSVRKIVCANEREEPRKEKALRATGAHDRQPHAETKHNKNCQEKCCKFSENL